ncbi:MAG: hypothetical protein KatS3mg105_4510 [Gemmatales bacterium]|nr:MAG: hypothetical protein KatS3mg105_4510 [Gemmatales bacterium]
MKTLERHRLRYEPDTYGWKSRNHRPIDAEREPWLPLQDSYPEVARPLRLTGLLILAMFVFLTGFLFAISVAY